MSEISVPQTTQPAPARRQQAMLVGGALGVFALGALATALVLEAPRRVEPAAAPTPAVAAVAPKPGPARGTVKEGGARSSGNETAPLETQHAAAPACATCGVVEAVTPVQHKGEASGIGAVAGGVLGGVVGHQVGRGDGNKAMTVLGAIGGGLAGNEIEKRQKSTTVYQLKIRMADGSTRNITQAQALAVGQRVQVDGQHVTPSSTEDRSGGRAVDTAGRST